MSNYAFCERVTATAESPWHIRLVGSEGLKLGGGAPDSTLCGRPLHKGWDLQLHVDDESVDGRHICADCSAVWLIGGTA